MRAYVRTVALIAALLGIYMALAPVVASGAAPGRIEVSISRLLTSFRS